MPKFTHDEIKGRVADGSIFAITVDTSIFDKYGCNLDFVILRKLDQFRKSNVRVLLSAVVSNEVVVHIARDAAETRRELKSALKKHAKRWKLTGEQGTAAGSLFSENEPIGVAERQLADFLDAVGAELISAAGSVEVSRRGVTALFRRGAPI